MSIIVDKPEGVIGDTVVYTNIGDTVVLTAFTMFVGNPVPYQVWISPNNDTITHSNDSIKYSVSFTDTIQLTIHDVNITDAGQWIFGASNSVGSISTNIDLVIAGENNNYCNYNDYDNFRSSWSTNKLIKSH